MRCLGGGMKNVIVSFEGDHRGYRLPLDIDEHLFARLEEGPYWVKAEVGVSQRFVWIDLSRAYAFDPNPW